MRDNIRDNIRMLLERQREDTCLTTCVSVYTHKYTRNECPKTVVMCKCLNVKCLQTCVDAYHCTCRKTCVNDYYNIFSQHFDSISQDMPL